MKITICMGPCYPVPLIRGGAVQRMWWGVARELAKRGHEVTIFARAFPHQPKTEASDGIRIVRWGGFDQGTNIRVDLMKGLLYGLGAVGKVPAGDVIITNDFWLPVLLPRMRPRAGKVVASIARFPKGQFWLYHGVDKILAVSAAVAEGIRKQTPAIADKVDYVPNCVDEEFLRDLGVKGLRGSGTGKVTVLYVGRIHPEKGVELLLEAWTTALSQKGLGSLRESGAKLRIVGPWRKEQGGGGAEYLETLKQKAEGVEWGEPMYGLEEVAAVYDTGDILVYPSVAETGEAMPLAPLEGMARGLPVVVSNLEVFREYLVPGRNGVSFEHRGGRAAENLADALAKLVEDPSLRQAMSKEARATAEKYAPGNVADLYVQAFENLLRG